MSEATQQGSMESAPSWLPGPDRPPPLGGAVDVWRVDLGAVAGESLAPLNRRERDRARRIVDERRRAVWMRSHALLRTLLGSYLGVDPAALRFAAGAYGKPHVLDPAAAGDVERTSTRRPAISFNMSHSGTVALYAFASAGAVGVDVELARRPVDELAIAARMLGEATAERLRSLDPAARRREFLRAWVRHEARLKCLGLGIGDDGPGSREPVPWLADLDMGCGAAGAVAAAPAPCALRCWQWSS